MATIDDQASDHEAAYLAEALRFRKPIPRNTGFCLNCKAETTGAYCSPECRDDDEARKNFKIGKR